MKLTTQLFSTLFVLLTILPLRVDAHLHSWITLKTEFMLDEKGRLTELQQHWEFDVYFSMMTLADIMNEYEDQKKGLEQLAKDMVNNLRSYDYFSELNIDNQPVGQQKQPVHPTRKFENDPGSAMHFPKHGRLPRWGARPTKSEYPSEHLPDRDPVAAWL